MIRRDFFSLPATFFLFFSIALLTAFLPPVCSICSKRAFRRRSFFSAAPVSYTH